MRPCYNELTTDKKNSLVSSILNSEGLPTIETSQFLVLLENTTSETKLYQKCKDDIESELQEKLLTTDTLENMFSDPWLSSWLIIKNMLWSEKSNFVTDTHITIPTWEDMFKTVSIVKEEKYVTDDNGNRIIKTKQVEQDDGSIITVRVTDDLTGTYVYETTIIEVVKGWITLYSGFGDRIFVYDVEDKKYYGMTTDETLKNHENRTLLNVFSDKYSALI